jgi:hypothetical protein
MATKYVFTDVPVGDGLNLYIDGNSKITAGNGSYEEPVPNALSLPHISTCPGATSECLSTCYVYNLQDNAPEVYKKYAQNERVMHRILLSDPSMETSAEALGTWISESCPDGFRWHVSGDIMHARHAQWIARVAQKSPKVRHWIYTRTFGAVGPLLLAPNLAVNISGDAANYREARKVAKMYGLRVCYMTRDGSLPDDLEEGEVIFPDYNLRGRDMDKPTEHEWWQGLSQEHRRMVCPPDFFGQSERHRCGPCKKCLHPHNAAFKRVEPIVTAPTQGVLG